MIWDSPWILLLWSPGCPALPETHKKRVLDSIPSWGCLSSSLARGRSDAGPQRQLGQGRAGERCWKRERRDLIGALEMGSCKGRSIPSQHSTCQAPQPTAFSRTGRSSLAARLLSSRFAGSSMSHELPAAPSGLRNGGQQQLGQEELQPPSPPATWYSQGRATPLCPYIFGSFFSLFISIPRPASLLHAADSRKGSGRGAPRGWVFLPHTPVLPAGRTQRLNTPKPRESHEIAPNH